MGKIILIISFLVIVSLFVYSLLSLNPIVEVSGNVSENITDNITSDNITFRARSDVREYVISTGLPGIRLRQQFGLLSDNETGYGWDCDDFARALAEQARIDGQEIGLALTIKQKYNGTVKVHMTNFVIIGNRIEQVSAQTGRVREYWGGIRIKVD